MIQLDNISKEFTQKNHQVMALTDITLEIKANEFFGLVGVSGSGKSTLLRLVNGLEETTSGTIKINQEELTKQMTKKKRDMIQKISMVFQQFNLLQNLTVQKNVELPLKVQGKSDGKIVSDMLDFVGMTEHKHKYPSQLSGGQKQRVAIARALTTRPKILLCDEPTSALDEHNGHEVMKLLKKAQTEFGTTIVFVSHELEVIKRWCDRAAIMESGKILSIVTVNKSDHIEDTTSYVEKAVRYLS
ncbi:ATP-binding cassette domain-containing protein [Vagococcus sp. DIV0080]|uniref:ATP-binding cassette domain-containing protein n=1 Tax=Candidatus Vagococcus giribetii TaxID=2230876 RepID=A0ABS3HVU8_9ENTE|nr:ATP-binding cassette domain-containing protein [Vagococcus sp. DIV0080]MBO0477859.1 ATP-binding cassette domain-containing protein [Vagococcus sp. DIV0080]